MGVDGLLPFCSSAFADAHVSVYRGKVVGIDASCWLHRGAIACADDLALRPDDLRHERYLGFALKMLKMLLSHGITPLCVFDGGSHPLKEATTRARRERRTPWRDFWELGYRFG